MLDALCRMTDAVSRASREEDVYRAVLHNLASSTGAAAVRLVVEGPDGALRLAGCVGLPGGLQAVLPLPMAAPPDEDARSPVVEAVSDIAHDTVADALHEAGITAVVQVPLPDPGRTAGQLTLFYRDRDNVGPDDVRLAATVASQVGAGVARIRDEAELRRRGWQAAFLADATSAITSAREYRQALERLARLCTPLLADWCAVYTLDDGRLVRAATAADNPVRARIARRLGGRALGDQPSVIRTAIESAQPRLLGPIDARVIRSVLGRDDEQFRLVQALNPTSAMIAPLTARGETLGGIAFVACDESRRYSEDDLRFAVEVANRAAVAVEHARLLEAAELGNRAKSQFLATMSHELRTPLNAVLGYADLLAHQLDGPLDPSQLEHVDRIKACAFHLRSIIEEILVFARVDAAREEIYREQVDLVEVCRDAALIVAPIVGGRELEVHTRLPDAPVPYETDRVKLRQVLVNLLTNAVRYTERGSVTLSLTEMEEGPVVSVEDTGPGIHPSEQARIFEPFTRGGTTTEEGSKGTGLGLAVTRRYVALLGGRIGLRSSVGEGTTFYVRLPRQS